MDGQSTHPRKAQLDKEEREHLEDVVTEMRDRVEANVRYQLEDEYDLDEKPDTVEASSDEPSLADAREDGDASLSEEQEDLVEAIELEAVDGNDWDDGYEQYITGVGYTIVNRLAALRCMEVRDFIDDEVTAFRDDGLTPAADRLVTEEFMLEEEAVLEAYRNACDDLAKEIDILFDRSTAYSQIDPDDDTYEDLCEMLDRVPNEVWRADDVLGWVYEYYNVKLLDELRSKARTQELESHEVSTANQFYTPHWVVRMLTDNSLGKLYLESKGELQTAVEKQKPLTPDERKNRTLEPNDTSDIADFCTYLVPSEEGEPPAFDDPADIRVIDPACGSGHFLLYAFDILERIWQTETNIDYDEIPRKILQHNIYGVDIDLRACQLAAFNLYLKGRTRAEAEGSDGFEMPEIGIVCSDAKVADVDGVEEVFEEVADGRSDVENALSQILDAFEEVHGLGSLLDVRGTLSDIFEDQSGGQQLTLTDDFTSEHSLSEFLHSLRKAIEEHRDVQSFLAQDLKSFIRLLDILSLKYDVALMNPPYGSQNRMPQSVRNYVDSSYTYSSEYYINFAEQCANLTKDNGRIGMLIPRTFMFRHRYEDFRKGFLGELGSFDFLSEFGVGILDNATVRTVGTVVRTNSEQVSTGNFIRLYDVNKGEKEREFTKAISKSELDVKRLFEVSLNEFSKVPGTTICYSTPKEIRELHNTDLKLDAEQAGINGESIGAARQGLATANDDRFVRYYWEIEDYDLFRPIAKGGADAWIVPHITETVEWDEDGTSIKRSSKTIRTRNEEMYGKGGLTWTFMKETGRRFGYYPSGGLFSHTGFLFMPKENKSIWRLLAVINSDLYHALMLSLTIERNWNAGEVGSVPWIESLEDHNRLEEIAKEQYQTAVRERFYEETSPYYIAPKIAPDSIHNTDFFYNHPHTSVIGDQPQTDSENISPVMSITEAARESERQGLQTHKQLEDLYEQTNEIIYESVGISEETKRDLLTEIFLRTAEDPEDREVSDPKSIAEVPENLNEQTKNLVHYFAMEAVREEEDGIIPLEGTDEQADMLGRIVERFEGTYGEYAEDRLVEVDDILGAESAADEAYPNLRSFIEDELFAYHVDTMENTPIVWKLSTGRLLADAKGEGFTCFVDYHQIDASLFDRLSNQYLEPRKAELRDRRSAANQRRNDESLSTSERADATDEFEFCSSALEQIAEFEEVLQELGSTKERDFDDDDRERVDALVPKVVAFREETAERIETMAELREQKGEEWFEDTFSPSFWEKVNEWRDEWLDALSELEYACEEYAKPTDEPVEAHLADLFDYFNWRLKGSDHYSSTGMLFMTYYFDSAGAELLDEDGEPFDTLTDDEQMLASLAMGLDDASVVDEAYLEEMVDDDDDVDSVDDVPPLAEYKALAEEIDDRCQSVYKQIPSDWKDRALSEVTTAGYQPNHKHGVAINIMPLAEKSVVPEIVEDKVL